MSQNLRVVELIERVPDALVSDLAERLGERLSMPADRVTKLISGRVGAVTRALQPEKAEAIAQAFDALGLRVAMRLAEPEELQPPAAKRKVAAAPAPEAAAVAEAAPTPPLAKPSVGKAFADAEAWGVEVDSHWKREAPPAAAAQPAPAPTVGIPVAANEPPVVVEESAAAATPAPTPTPVAAPPVTPTPVPTPETSPAVEVAPAGATRPPLPWEPSSKSRITPIPANDPPALVVEDDEPVTPTPAARVSREREGERDDDRGAIWVDPDFFVDTEGRRRRRIQMLVVLVVGVLGFVYAQWWVAQR